MSDLVTLATAKNQLRIVDDSDDAYLATLVSASSKIIVDYLKTDVAKGWDVSDADNLPPPEVQQATLLVLASLYEDREGVNDPIGVAVASVLMRSRDPTLV